MDLAELYQKQISLSEWFADIDHEATDAFREEDNWKRKRMEELAEIIPFPFDKPTSFQATEVVEMKDAFNIYFEAHKNELCALRLIPKKEGLPKLRMRGMTVADVVSNWLPQQDIDEEYYQADFVPHPSDHIWSTIFISNGHGAIGEVIAGSHNQLTQGFHDDGKPIVFRYEYTTDEVTTNPATPEVYEHIKEIISFLRIDTEEKRKEIEEKFHVSFLNGYLPGYFETVKSTDHGTWFIDWNRVLGDLYKDFWPEPFTQGTAEHLTGTVGSPGSATGTARIIHPDAISSAQFEEGDILLCLMTSPDYVPLMKHAGAVITQEGGILSHAAIVSREMKLPCVVGVKDIFEHVKDGDRVEVDAEKGIVRKL